MAGLALGEHLGRQLERLCRIVETDSVSAKMLLADLLGPFGHRPLAEPPAWPSDVADDHTPAEFSIAFNEGTAPALRILAEALGSPPGPGTNLAAAHRFVAHQAERFGLSLARFKRVRGLFSHASPRSAFSLWHSLVLRRARPPAFKVYFNPEIA